MVPCDSYLVWDGNPTAGYEDEFSRYNNKTINDLLQKYKAIVIEGKKHEFG